MVGGQADVDARYEPAVAFSRGGVLADDSLLEERRVAPVSERDARIDLGRQGLPQHRQVRESGLGQAAPGGPRGRVGGGAKIDGIGGELATEQRHSADRRDRSPDATAAGPGRLRPGRNFADRDCAARVGPADERSSGPRRRRDRSGGDGVLPGHDNTHAEGTRRGRGLGGGRSRRAASRERHQGEHDPKGDPRSHE